MNPTFYDEDYFIRGKETGKSLYTDYRWLPELTVPMAKAVASHLRMAHGDAVLDFGCARGYLVRALREIGYLARGYDPSQWVIDHCDPEVVGLVDTVLNEQARYDWVIAKDVLEHVSRDDLRPTVTKLGRMAVNGVFAAVPLSPAHGAAYVVPEYEKDVTHEIRMTLEGWHELFEFALNALDGTGWKITSTYRVPGVKDNYYDAYPQGNGFITATRV